MRHTDQIESIEQSVREVTEAVSKAVLKGDKSDFIIEFHLKELKRVNELLGGLYILQKERELQTWKQNLALQVAASIQEIKQLIG